MEGDGKAVKARHTLTNMIEAANDDVLVCLDELARSIADEVRTIHTHYRLYLLIT